jgi:hypothetical protein
MPRKTDIILSEDDYDELLSGDEEDVDAKPDTGPFGGTITKPRHVTTSTKSLFGKSAKRSPVQ